MRWGRRTPEPEDEVAHADDDRIATHLEQSVGPLGPVWQELVSERIHIDVHVVPPGAGHEYVLLVTSGMSARPMTVPAGVARRREREHAELLLRLPADWPLAVAAAHGAADEAGAWPVRLLRELARVPHERGGWLTAGHSVALDDLPEPYAGVVLIAPAFLGDAASIPGEPPVALLQCLPVTAEELEFQRSQGVTRLVASLDPRRVLP
jgi:hypothetical protein